MEKISVIVPVYNSEKYIKDCILSILNQSYKNFELILVNDGSTDNSAIICEHFSSDARVRYFCKKNEGVSAARNKGINEAVGNFICFVDSDDLLEQECLQKMINAIHDFDADIVITGYKKNYGCYQIEERIGDIQIENQIQIVHYFETHFREAIASSVWGKLYKKEMIKTLFDVSMTMGEDLVFNINYFSNINKCVSLDEPLYLYNLTNSNSLASRLSLKKYKQTVMACCVMQNWLSSSNYLSEGCNNAQIKIADNFYSFAQENATSISDINVSIEIFKEMRNDKAVIRALSVAKKHFRLHHRLLFRLFLKRKYRLCVYFLKLIDR